ncbi:MAG TPA: hypothetical protein VK992_02560 [Candidatus Caenarcaniphilales bacterium]|nr:hypothetical protein [Candidatus Caenarcaniphilales bacterium]
MPLFPAIIVLALAHAFDYVSFILMTKRHGLEAELNPLVILLAQNVGLPGLTVAKVAAVVLAAVAILIIARRRPRVAMAVMVLGSVAGLVGGLSNVMTLAAF